METIGHNPNNEIMSSGERAVLISEFQSSMGYCDEIPNEIVHDGEYKVRKAWFAGLGWAIRYMEAYPLPDDINNAIKGFKAKFQTREFADKELVERSDIDYANQFVSRMIKYLEEE